MLEISERKSKRQAEATLRDLQELATEIVRAEGVSWEVACERAKQERSELRRKWKPDVCVGLVGGEPC